MNRNSSIVDEKVTKISVLNTLGFYKDSIFNDIVNIINLLSLTEPTLFFYIIVNNLRIINILLRMFFYSLVLTFSKTNLG
jgi:hypothetical protein